jgi:hypothetical protein
MHAALLTAMQAVSNHMRDVGLFTLAPSAGPPAEGAGSQDSRRLSGSMRALSVSGGGGASVSAGGGGSGGGTSSSDARPLPDADEAVELLLAALARGMDGAGTASAGATVPAGTSSGAASAAANAGSGAGGAMDMKSSCGGFSAPGGAPMSLVADPAAAAKGSGTACRDSSGGPAADGGRNAARGAAASSDASCGGRSRATQPEGEGGVLSHLNSPSVASGAADASASGGGDTIGGAAASGSVDNAAAPSGGVPSSSAGSGSAAGRSGASSASWRAGGVGAPTSVFLQT